MMHKIYVTRKIPQQGLDLLKRYAEVKIWEGELPPPRDILRKEIREVDGILTLLTDRIDKEILGAAKTLKSLATMLWVLIISILMRPREEE